MKCRGVGFAALVCLALAGPVFLFCGTAESMEIRSGAFGNEDKIPARYTGVGENVSPPFSWRGVPAGTVSFVLIADDLDAPSGIWTHWIIYDIPSSARSLAEGIPKLRILDEGGVQGTNSFRRIGYDGPYPPPGSAHRYVFKLYALDDALSIDPGVDKGMIARAMKGHVLAEASVTGTFGR